MNYKQFLGLEEEIDFKKDDELLLSFFKGFPTIPNTSSQFYHSVTSLSSCPRKRYYYFDPNAKTNPVFPDSNKKEDVLDVYPSWAFLGNAIESEVIRIIMSKGRLIQSQVYFQDAKLRISGKCDAVIQVPELFGDELIPTEIKSAGKYAYESNYQWQCIQCQRKRWWNSNVCSYCSSSEPAEKVLVSARCDMRPKYDNFCQILAYLHLSGGAYKRGLLWYYAKDNGHQSLYWVYPNERIWNAMVELTKELDAYLEMQMVPPRPFKKAVFDDDGLREAEDWRCKYCEFSFFCWQDLIEKFKPVLYEKIMEAWKNED